MKVKDIKDMGKRNDISGLMDAYRNAKAEFRNARSNSKAIAVSRIVDAAYRELQRRGYAGWLVSFNN